MIKYALRCEGGHGFEAWFSKGSDFDDQAKTGLIACPECGGTQIEKAIMSPAIVTSRSSPAKPNPSNSEPRNLGSSSGPNSNHTPARTSAHTPGLSSRSGPKPGDRPNLKGASSDSKANAVMTRQGQARLEEIAANIRAEISKSCEDVGGNFADEARAIHYGEKEERAIYGSATPREVADLTEEGVNIAPLPEALVPKPKSKLN